MTSGDVLLCDLNPVAGREKGGIRPGRRGVAPPVCGNPGAVPRRSDEIMHYDQADVHPLVLRSVLLAQPGVLDYQVRQTARGAAVHVLLERQADLPQLCNQLCNQLRNQLRDQLCAALARAGLADPEVTVEAVPALPRHPETGKLRRVIPAGEK